MWLGSVKWSPNHCYMLRDENETARWIIRFYCDEFGIEVGWLVTASLSLSLMAHLSHYYLAVFGKPECCHRSSPSSFSSFFFFAIQFKSIWRCFSLSSSSDDHFNWNMISTSASFPSWLWFHCHRVARMTNKLWFRCWCLTRAAIDVERSCSIHNIIVIQAAFRIFIAMYVDRAIRLLPTQAYTTRTSLFLYVSMPSRLFVFWIFCGLEAM